MFEAEQSGKIYGSIRDVRKKKYNSEWEKMKFVSNANVKRYPYEKIIIGKENHWNKASYEERRFTYP